jgi:transcriptional regulator with XRE-family HTH domain
VVREPGSIAEARQNLGAELAAYRLAAGLTQAKLAVLVKYSRSTIANVETGRQLVPRAFWERCETVLRTGGTLTAAFDDLDAAIRGELRTAARTVTATRQARARSRSFNTSASNGTGAQPVGGPAQARSESMPWWPARLTPALTENGRMPISAPDAARGRAARQVRPGDVARLRSMRAHLKAIDNAHGGGAALPMATWYLRQEILPLLDDSAKEPGAVLTGVVAEVRHDLGWMAYDAGKQHLASSYFTSALRLAKAAGNRLLGGRILAAMSHQAIYLGHLRQAIEFAQAARNLTRQVATPRVVAMEAAMEACAHAAAGDARACHRALADAAAAVELISNGQDEPQWLDFDEGGYWGHAARAYRDLGNARKAEECAVRSVGLCLTGHSRTRAQRTTIQATAYLRLAEIDAAAAAGEHIVQEAWNLHSGHVFGEVAQLAAALRPFSSPVTSDFLDQAHELLTARAPTAGHPASSR